MSGHRKANREKVCQWCGKTFIAKTKYVKTCCSECSHALAAKTCTERGKRFKRVYNVNDKFLKQESNVKYYYLGLMAADGNVKDLSKYNTSTKQISISQSGDSGLLLIQYLKDLLDCDAPIREAKPKKGKLIYSLCFTSNEIYEDFCDNNIVPNKTRIFKIPDYILQDNNKLRYFIIGYIDGDGCINYYKNSGGTCYYLHISFVCNEKMRDQLKNTNVFKSCKIRKGCGGNVWEFRFNGRCAINFGNWLYENLDTIIFKSYKYEHFIQYMNNRYEFSPRLRRTELKRDIMESLDNNPNLTSNEIHQQFNVTLAHAQNLKYEWRKQNGLVKPIIKRFDIYEKLQELYVNNIDITKKLICDNFNIPYKKADCIWRNFNKRNSNK